ncbi:hypothetical protein ACJX0J_021981 [Zea mays]
MDTIGDSDFIVLLYYITLFKHKFCLTNTMIMRREWEGQIKRHNFMYLIWVFLCYYPYRGRGTDAHYANFLGSSFRKSYFPVLNFFCMFFCLILKTLKRYIKGKIMLLLLFWDFHHTLRGVFSLINHSI